MGKRTREETEKSELVPAPEIGGKKRSKKHRSDDELPVTAKANEDPDAASAKEEKKRRKREKRENRDKAAQKGAEEAPQNGALSGLEKSADQASGAVNVDEPSKDIETGHQRQANGAARVDDHAIKHFMTAKMITVHGPEAESLKPVIRFEQLPPECRHPAIFAGFTEPTPIQAAAWPFLLAGRDVVGVAETGSGKTLAFGVPCVRHVNAKMEKKRSKLRSVIVSPTRELALQIYEQMAKLVEGTAVKVVCVYGGVPKDGQRTDLAKSQVVIATPGRLMDFIQEGSADLSHVSYFVLDEADRMLDKGFEEDVRKIAGAIPTGKAQTAMFTATWPETIRKLADTFMKDPIRINIGDNPDGDLRANVRVTQKVEVVDPAEKEQRLLQLLKQYQSGKNRMDRILVFCLYKKEAARIERFISSRGFAVAGIHGDLSQEARTKALNGFRDGSVPLLVATDVAARGLDIPAVKAVINVTCKPSRVHLVI